MSLILFRGSLIHDCAIYYYFKYLFTKLNKPNFHLIFDLYHYNFLYSDYQEFLLKPIIRYHLCISLNLLNYTFRQLFTRYVPRNIIINIFVANVS